MPTDNIHQKMAVRSQELRDRSQVRRQVRIQETGDRRQESGT